jgi:hypothetical protein
VKEKEYERREKERKGMEWTMAAREGVCSVCWVVEKRGGEFLLLGHSILFALSPQWQHSASKCKLN